MIPQRRTTTDRGDYSVGVVVVAQQEMIKILFNKLPAINFSVSQV